MIQSVVELTEIGSEIALVTVKDKVNKNTFSKELVSGLFQAFEAIESNDKFKVVVITGYDSYFLTGSTLDKLLYIYEGTTNFIDLDAKDGKNFYSLALDCRIPVISAMQGHAIGGGFVFGLFADFVILSKESFYSTNFMKYGFTPGVGATYILKEKLGFSLSEELLLSAESYKGTELEIRGIPFKVLPRQEVLEAAIELAKLIADKPRNSLITLKDHLVEHIREELPSIIQKELVMHDKTFHQPEVKDRIYALFGK